jgi:hypothetical protein
MPSLLNQKMPFHYPLILNKKKKRKRVEKILDSVKHGFIIIE